MISAFLQHPAMWLGSIGLGAIWLSRLFAVGLNMHKIPEITLPEFDTSPVNAAGRVPFVSIVVPARNEAEHIETALVSLLQLDYPDYEVIAVDDRSEDDTGAILDRVEAEWRERGEASHHRLKVLHVTELPSGWLGKTHAMWQAGKHATGDWVLFTDADVIFRDDALRRAVVYAEWEQADHLVLFPTMIMKSPGERMMIAFFQSQFVFGHRPWKVADPKSRDSMGVGAFNLVRRMVYQNIGTYERLRLAVLDDMKLGELVKQEGYRQRVAFGRDLLKLRWVFGAMGMVRNLTKNFFAIFDYNAAFAVLAIIGIMFVNVGPFVGVWIAQGWVRAGFVAALVSIVAIYCGMAMRSDISPFYVVLHPVGTTLFSYAVMRSVVLTLFRGGVVWRGTLYPLSELKKFSRDRPRWNWL